MLFSALRVLVELAGALLLYVAVFLYEDERGVIQNRLENAWIRIDDLHKHAVAKHVAFLNELATLVSRLLERVFGKKIVSLRSVAISVMLSICSYFVTSEAPNLHSWKDPKAFLMLLVPVVLLLPFLTIGESKEERTILNVLSFFIVLTILVVPFRQHWSQVAILMWYAMLIGGTMCDFLFFAANRLAFQWASTLVSAWKIIVVIAMNVALAVLLTGPVALMTMVLLHSASAPNISGLADVPTSLSFYVFGTLLLVSATNLFIGLYAMGIVALMIVLMAHRSLWPVLTRPLYATVQHRSVRNPKFVGFAGLLLILWGIPIPTEWVTSLNGLLELIH